jgi:hypothetical protein
MTALLDSSTVPQATRVRGPLAAVVLASAALTQIVLLLVRPWGERNDFLYDSVEPIRSNLWTGMFVDGITFAAIGITLSFVVCDLVRTRGSALATLGAVVTSLGAILYAMGALAVATIVWYATSTSAIGVDAGRDLMDYAIGSGAQPKASPATIPTIAGFMTFTVGSVLLFAALIRAAVVPRWLPITLLVATFGEFLSQGRVADMVQIVWMALAVTLAVFAVKGRQS